VTFFEHITKLTYSVSFFNLLDFWAGIMSSTAVFHRGGDEPALFARLAACSSVSVISESFKTDMPSLRRADLRNLTLKEVLQLNPICAYTANQSTEHDQFVIKNGQLIVSLTPESDTQFGLVSNEKSRAKGQYTYDVRKLNKRVLWALDNTITAKYDFYVHSESNEVVKPSSRSLRIAVPPLEYKISRKRPSQEPEMKKDVDIDLLGFDDWATEFVEWAGLAVMNPQLLADQNGGVDSAICNYFHPQNSTMQNVAILKFQGPFLASQVLELWNSLLDWSVLVANGVPQVGDRPLKGGHHKPRAGRFDNSGAVLISNPRSHFHFRGY